MENQDTNLPYGTIAFKMVKELSRQARIIGNPFDESGKQAVVEEINQLFARTALQMEALANLPPSEVKTPYIQTELLLQHNAVLRNKRCMMAYLMGRVRMIQALRWQLSSETLPEEVISCLSPQEKKFKDDYNEILRQYMSELDLDLTLNLHEPPKDLNIEVLVLQDYGSILTDDGSITLKKNTTVTMSRSVAEPLIKVGVLKHITDIL